MLTSAQSEGQGAGECVGGGRGVGEVATLESIMNLISRAILVLLINAVASVTSAAQLDREREGKGSSRGRVEWVGEDWLGNCPLSFTLLRV